MGGRGGRRKEGWEAGRGVDEGKVGRQGGEVDEGKGRKRGRRTQMFRISNKFTDKTVTLYLCNLML